MDDEAKFMFLAFTSVVVVLISILAVFLALSGEAELATKYLSVEHENGTIIVNSKTPMCKVEVKIVRRAYGMFPYPTHVIMSENVLERAVLDLGCQARAVVVPIEHQEGEAEVVVSMLTPDGVKTVTVYLDLEGVKGSGQRGGG